jgi:hypothetical protein
VNIKAENTTKLKIGSKVIIDTDNLPTPYEVTEIDLPLVRLSYPVNNEMIDAGYVNVSMISKIISGT